MQGNVKYEAVPLFLTLSWKLSASMIRISPLYLLTAILLKLKSPISNCPLSPPPFSCMALKALHIFRPTIALLLMDKVLSPINVSTDPSFDNSGDFLNDMEKAINAKNPQFIGLAATIRHKYSQILHSLELSKDGANQREKRLGYQLISYVIDKKSVDEVYKNWRNLCILVHSDTEKDNDLVKGDDSQRRRALLSALNTYKSKLYPFEKRNE